MNIQDKEKDFFIQIIKDENISAEQLRIFSSMENINEKLSFANEYLKTTKLYNEIPIIPLRYSKNNLESLKHLNEAVKYSTLDGLKHWNQSIALAETDTEYLFSCYSERSKILYELEMYSECLRDIKLILKSKYYSDELHNTFERVKKNCENESRYIPLTNSEQNYINILTKLTYPSNEKLPFIANCLESMDLPKYGRSIITTRDLKVGDIISIEQSFAAALLPKLKYKYCSNCLLHTYTLIPCPTCTSAMYCSHRCLKISYDRYHKYECPVIDYLFEACSETSYLNAIRNVLQAISLFENNIDELMEFDEKSKKSDIITYLFDMDFSMIGYDDDDDDDNNMVYNENDEKSDEEYMSKMTIKSYYPIHAMLNNVSQMSGSLYEAMLTIVSYKILVRNTILKHCVKTKEQKMFLKNLLYRHIKLHSRNFDTYETIYIHNNPGASIRHCGSAVHPLSTLLNHSCAPNIKRVFNGTKAIVVVLRPIPKGEQLFECYDCHNYIEINKKSREFLLECTYNIKCECEACLNDYATQMNLMLNPNIPDETFPVDEVEFTNMCEISQQIATFLNKYSTAENYPCKQIAGAEMKFFECISWVLQNMRYLISKHL